MEIVELINHPEHLDRDTLYELRSLLALYPYYQPARLLLLQNLYLLHDPTFDEELRRAAIYITDRRVLFEMIEAAHYRYPSLSGQSGRVSNVNNAGHAGNSSRTITLIDNFLDSIPQEEAPAEKKRKPTPADAAVDYVAYLMEVDSDIQGMPGEVPQMPGQDLIDAFINSDKKKFVLSDVPLPVPQEEKQEENMPEGVEEEYFTETLARIYIKQGRYSKALEIIRRLSLQVPKKNAYFADQIRFLEKLIINSNQK